MSARAATSRARWPWLPAAGVVLALGLPHDADAQLVVDLSDDLIGITAGFAGSEVVLFGTAGAAAEAVIVVVRGPPTRVTLREKARVGPFWLDRQSTDIRDVPAFYTVAASGPLPTIATEAELQDHAVGAQRLPLVERGEGARPPREVVRQALLRGKAERGLYPADIGRVSFVGGRLFRTTLRFPGNVPPGRYGVEVLELAKGRVIGMQTRSLTVSKLGLEATLADLAERRPAAYGLVAVLLAGAAGWTAAWVFKRR